MSTEPGSALLMTAAGGSALKWPAALAAGACAAAVAALAWPTLLELHELWTGSYTYSHGYLVVAIAVVLAVRALRAPAAGESRLERWLAPPVLAIATLTLVALAIIAARATFTAIVGQMALPALLLSTAWAVAGPRVAARTAWPAAILYFAVPVWDLLTTPLRELTTGVVSAWVRLAGVPSFIDGNRIHVPAGTFEVADGCSGLHFVIVGLSLASVYAASFHVRARARVSILLAALGAALLANWIRVFLLVVVGHASNMEHSLIVDGHYAFGWVVFFVVILPVFVVASRFEPRGVSRDGGVTPGGRTVASLRSSSTQLRVCCVAAAVVMSGVWLDRRASEPYPESVSGPFSLPAVSGWSPAGAWTDARRPRFVGPDSEAAQWFVRGEDRIGAYLAHYVTQAQGREVVFFANRPGGSSAGVLGRRPVKVPLADGAVADFVELQVADGAEDARVVLAGFRVGGFTTANPLAAKAWQALAAALGRRDAQALVLTSACEGGCGAARRRLYDFAAAGTLAIYSCAERLLRSEVERPGGKVDAHCDE